MDNWESVKAVQRMQDYIDSHIMEDITLSQLSKVAGYSSWHSARIFKKLLNKSPFEYIRAVRLSKAALVLRDEQPRVIDVALDFDKPVPEGFEIIEQPPCKMMVFQGEPYEDVNFTTEISSLMKDIDNYNPEIYGFKLADDSAPRFQLAPMGYRGYIEARPIKEINKIKNI